MGHDRFFYTFLLLAVLWLCMILSWLWPQSRAMMGQLQPTAAKRAKTPTKAPKPFAGLTQQPLCQACQQATKTRQQAPCALHVVRKNWISMLCKGFLAFSHIAAWLTPPWTSALEVATISL